MTDDLDLEQRLRDLGEVPLDPAIADSHRLAMARVVAEGGGRRPRFGWKAVAAAAVAGFLVGSSGLAAAGALPDPAQDVAHDVLDAVGIDVPRSTEGCPEGTSYRNHGAYVSSVEAAGGDVEAAAKSDCGKPVKGSGKGNGNGGAKGAGEPRADEDGDPCTGPPPWAGAHLTPEEKAAAQAAREATCGPDEDAAESDTEEDGAEQREAPVPDETTTTTVSPETTTTAPETTTTAPDTTTTTGS